MTTKRPGFGMSARPAAGRYWPVWLAVVPLLIWALVRTFGLEGDSRIVPLMAFTPYVAVAALLASGIAVALRNWAAATVAAIATACLAGAVLPRAFGSGEAVPPGARTLTVMSANVYHGAAVPSALVDLVRRIDPDILAIQELHPSFDRALRRAGIERYLPRSIVLLRLPGKPRHLPGIGVYSTLELHRLPRPQTSASLRLRATLPGGRTIRLVDFHPLTPLESHVDRWRQTFESLPTAGSGEPWLLLGDFNATLDQAALRDVLDRGYRDAGAVTGNGLVPTWPMGRRYPPLITIDHVLADRRLGIASYGVEDLRGSDHRAIHAELFLDGRQRR